MKFDLNKFLTLVGTIGPIVLANVPHGEKIATQIPTIIAAIGEAEQIKGATGAEKKAHVLSIVAAGVNVANASGHVTLDPATVQAVASSGIDAVIGAVQVVHDATPAQVPPTPTQTQAAADRALDLSNASTRTE